MTKKAPRVAGDLKAAPYNPRAMSPEQHELLAESMARFGDLSGVIFNRRTRRLIGAHQRRQHIADEAKIELHGRRTSRPDAQGTIAVGFINVDGERWSYREVDVDEVTEKAMNIAANRWGEGGWDFDMLPALMREISVTFALDLIGWDADGLAAMGFDAIEQLPDATPGDGASQLGDVQYQVIVSCADEHAQATLCEELERRGLECRLLTL